MHVFLLKLRLNIDYAQFLFKVEGDRPTNENNKIHFDISGLLVVANLKFYFSNITLILFYDIAMQK